MGWNRGVGKAKYRSAGVDDISRVQLVGRNALAVQPGAVPRIQIDQEEIDALPDDQEMAAGKRAVRNARVRKLSPAENQGSIAQFPALGFRTIGFNSIQKSHVPCLSIRCADE